MKFSNPYAGVEKLGFGPDGGARRISTSVPKDPYITVQLIRFSRGTGTVNTTINLLFSKLVNELKRRNIQDRTDADRFESFVANCVLADPSELNDASRLSRGTPGGSLPTSNGPDDRGGTTPVRSGPTDPQVESANLQGQNVGAKKQRRGNQAR